MINSTNKLDFNCKNYASKNNIIKSTKAYLKNKLNHKKIFFIFLVIIIIEICALFIFNDSLDKNSTKNSIKSLEQLISEHEINLAKQEAPQNITFNEPEKIQTIDTSSKSKIEQEDIVNKSAKVKSGDNLYDLFAALNLPINDLYQILKIQNLNKYLTNLKPGQEIKFTLNNNKLESLTFDINNLKQLVLTKKDNNYTYKYITKELESRVKTQKVTIKSSLYESIIEAKLPLNFLIKIADIFSWDIDFTTDIRNNDTITLVFEEMYLNNKKYSYGDILAIRFKNNKNTYEAIKYTNSKINAYYTPEGYNLKKAFIRTPVKYTRISSYFSVARNHPILHKIRSHKGVDYAAPYGTPIKAAGDGKIQFIGRKGGYGKTIILQHGNNYTTLYGHLAKYKQGLKNSKNVKQGDIIGYVGSTGLATGPHLHFEFRVNGIHKDPLTVKLPRANPIANKIKTNFLAYSNEILTKLDNVDNILENNKTLLASNSIQNEQKS